MQLSPIQTFDTPRMIMVCNFTDPHITKTIFPRLLTNTDTFSVTSATFRTVPARTCSLLPKHSGLPTIPPLPVTVRILNQWWDICCKQSTRSQHTIGKISTTPTRHYCPHIRRRASAVATTIAIPQPACSSHTMMGWSPGLHTNKGSFPSRLQRSSIGSKRRKIYRFAPPLYTRHDAGKWNWQ